MRNLKIFFLCSGVGIINRGIESFFREAFDGLRDTKGLDITLYKGAGEETTDETVLRNIPRTGRLAALLGRVIRRNSYVVEQFSSLPVMARAIRTHRPDIIFYSDSNLGFQLHRWRKQIGVPYRLLFSNGGPCHPPFDRTDYVHQVAPQYYEEAIAAGESPTRHRMVPYGINVPEGTPVRALSTITGLRRKLGLPLDRQIVLSVGWISAQHKRMDFLITEVGGLKAKAENSCPYLVMLGATDAESVPVLALAREILGEENFIARSVPYEHVGEYYQAADLFVLASLQEGFGRVFLEALIHGLPVIAHEHPVMRYVLGEEGTFGDLSKQGVLAELIGRLLSEARPPGAARRRRESVRSRFSWSILAPQYRDMFFDCVEKVRPL